MDQVALTQSIKGQLAHAWFPFFSKFGRLTEIQRQTIPLILAGQNVIISAPTASGKTESVVAPSAELLCDDDRTGLLMLYIVPTRALANDTLARVETPLSQMEIRTALKHGDKPMLPTRIPNCLITTPESLDSLVCRRPDIFFSLRTIILDEIHLLDNTYRGDQLRILLKRLEQIVTQPYSVHILSATLGKPLEVADRYHEGLTAVSVPGQREIHNQFLRSINELYDLVRRNRWKKVLVFANSRVKVESLAGQLSALWKNYPVVAHHGSLSREEREQAEEVMKDADVAVCVSTSTLEIGIDIGSIDLVVLADPPLSMSSLHQRLGRGNRRKQYIQSASIVETEEEEALLSLMFNLARTGKIEDEPYDADLSVIVQQAFSCLYSKPSGIPGAVLVELLGELASQQQILAILNHLGQGGQIEFINGRWYASAAVMDMGEKGIIHSNIPDQQERIVMDVTTGNKIGKIYGVPDSIFLLSGRAWQVQSLSGAKIGVRRFSGNAGAASFAPRVHHGAFWGYLPSQYRNQG